MKTIYFTIVALAMGQIFLSSCNNFLDTLPDNRTTLNTPKKITQLLVSAYPTANIALLAELSSDNFVDNNSPEVSTSNKLAPLERMHDEVFAWEPAVSSSEEDSPFAVWEQCYKAIATANHALEAIDELEKEDHTLNLDAQRGEALLCRAFGHFLLVNTFAQAYKDENTSKNDIGVPYITKPETTVMVDYERESVSDVYNKIEADIEAGIVLLNDDSHSVPKYHFNIAAANAFAARFYLYKRNYQKAVEHANRVLGNNPLNVLRKWNNIYGDSEKEGYAYIDANEAANLLIMPTNSIFFRTFQKTRYAFNGSALAMISSGGPAWYGWPPHYSGSWWWTFGQEYGVFCSKVNEMFEYTDKIAGIGYTHVVRTEFTTDETLLCRAEALLFLGRKDEAIADLNSWCISHQCAQQITEASIKGFYSNAPWWIAQKLNNQKMSSSFVVSEEQLPIVQCILHFRRIETIFEGLRWFDIKRYGIEINHFIGDSKIETLTWNDSRRAIQIPHDVIAVGMEPNPTKTTSKNTSLNIKPITR